MTAAGLARGSSAAAWLLAVVLGGAWIVPATIRAHPATATSAEAVIEADGRFRVVAQFDTLAFTLNDTSARIGNAPMEELLDGPREALEARLAEAKERFLHGFRVETDRGPGSVDAVDFPGTDKVLAWKATVTPVLPVVLAVGLSGHLPMGAGTVAFRFPTVLEQVVLTVERPGEEPTGEQVETGATSSAFPVKLVAPPSPIPAQKAAASVPQEKGKVPSLREWVLPFLLGCGACGGTFWIVRWRLTRNRQL